MALLQTKEKLGGRKKPGDMHQWNHLNIYSQLASVQRQLHDPACDTLESQQKQKVEAVDEQLKALEGGLAYLARVSALEKLFTNLVNAASARTSALAERSASGVAGRVSAPLRHAWDWLQLVQRCTLLHLRDASEYHQVLLFSIFSKTLEHFINTVLNTGMLIAAAPGGERTIGGR